MSSATLLADAALATATALLYAYVGMITLRRETSDAASRRAVRLFAVWWYGLAAITLLAALRNMLAVGGNTDLRLHAILGNAAIVPLVAALWGLVSYLAYIYTGDRRAFAAVTAFHVGVLVFLFYAISLLQPTAVKVGTWNVTLDYAEQLSASLVGLLIVAILAPALVAALAYATLYFRTDDRSARYRIAMVSGAFVLWFGIAAAASALHLNTLSWWPVASRVVGIVATLMVIAAYQPPGWFRQRFGLRSADESAATRYDEKKLRLARSTILLRLSRA